MHSDFEFDVAHPEVITNSQGSAIIIRCEVVDQPSGGPRLSGKYVHLAFTSGEAMRLLAILTSVQERLSLSTAPPPPNVMSIPPKKDRN
jgi:hypothetical protein